MDYAFGEQAYETMEELLKPTIQKVILIFLMLLCFIMGKAGILEGKGDIMIPSAHVLREQQTITLLPTNCQLRF